MRKYNFVFSILLIIALLCGCNTAADTTTASAAVTPSTYKTTQTGKLRVTYIDVGQGDSILITSPDNKHMLIDAGESENKSGAVLSYLKPNNIKSLDTAVATHPHSDHISAMDDVIKAVPINHFYMPNAVNTTRDFENMLNALEIVPDVVQAKAGMSFKLGEYVSCKVFAPVMDSYEDLNNYSVVIKLTYGNNSFVFTGDAEKISENEIISNGVDLKADVLKCGHHGSSGSSGESFLDAVSPSFAIISCAKDNSYGHPHRETLNALNSRGITVLRTDELGTITLESDGKNIITGNGVIAVTEGVTESTTSAKVTRDVTYIGNKNSKKYHKVDCTSLPKETNRVYFLSEQEAVNNGYSPCGNCNP